MRLNPNVAAVCQSPITEAYSWVGSRGGDLSALIDVSQAVPGYPPPESLREHVAEMARRPDTSRYTDQSGLSELREALARSTSEQYGAEIPASRVSITAGCNQAFCLVVSALAGPGDEVVLPLPFYFNHDMWLRAQGIRPVYLPPGEGLVPDPERARPLLGERTRALVLISPNNPTGAVYPPALFESFFELARSCGVALIVDETYRDFREVQAPPHALFSRSDWGDTLVHLYSFSKVFCLAGYRVGAVLAREWLLEEVLKLMDCVAICPPRIGQEAARFGLEHLPAWREQNRHTMSERLELFRRELHQRAPEWQIAASGAYFAYLRHPFNEPSRDVARRLAGQHGVLCLAGEMFGPGQEAFLRVAFANLGAERIPELVERLRAMARGRARRITHQSG